MISKNTQAATIVDDGTCGEDISWSLKDDGTLVICGNGEIPSYDISESPFYNNSLITTIKICQGITSIGDNAFSGCNNLNSLTIPNTLTNIEDNAFIGCNLTIYYYDDISISKNQYGGNVKWVLIGDVDSNNTINTDDAIFVLMHSQFIEDPTYAIYQEIDFNEDSQINSDDAIYLLLHTQFPEDYPIDYNERRLRMAVFSDIHVAEDDEEYIWEGNDNFNTFMTSINKNTSIDMLVSLGDYCRNPNGIYSSTNMTNAIDSLHKIKNFKGTYSSKIINGNHDSRYTNWEMWLKDTGCKAYWSEEILGNVFIFASTFVYNASDGAIYTKEEQKFVLDTISAAKNDGKRVFLFTHFYYPIDGIFGCSSNGSQWVVDTSTQYFDYNCNSFFSNIYNLSDDNMIWFCGHGHSGFECQNEYRKTIKTYYEEGKPLMLSTPSLGQNGQYYIIDIFDNKIVVCGYSVDGSLLNRNMY